MRVKSLRYFYFSRGPRITAGKTYRVASLDHLARISDFPGASNIQFRTDLLRDKMTEGVSDFGKNKFPSLFPPAMKKFRTALQILVPAAVFGVLELYFFLQAVNAPVNDNEQMYLPCSVLFGKFSLYQDFGYFQLPNLPVLLGTLYRLTGTSHYLFLGRLLVFLCANLAALLIGLFTRRLTRDYLASVLTPFLFLANASTFIASMQTANYIAPIPFAILGLYLFHAGISEDKPARGKIFWSGIFCALAIGFRLTFIFLLPPLYLIALFYPRSENFSSRLLKIILPLTIGSLLGFAPAFYYLLRDFHSFIYLNWTCYFNQDYYDLLGMRPRMPILAGIKYLTTYWDNEMLLELMLLFLALALAGVWLKPSKPVQKSNAVIMFLITLVLSIATLLVRPRVYPEYLSQPLPFALLCIAACHSRVAFLKKIYLDILLLVAALALALWNCPSRAEMKMLPRNYRQWAVTRVHDKAVSMREMIGGSGREIKVGTLYPLYALEGGMQIYNEFSTGPFLYIFESTVRHKSYGPATSPAGLNDLFDRYPPSALLVKPGDRFNAGFESYARSRRYQKLPDSFSGFVLYVR